VQKIVNDPEFSEEISRPLRGAAGHRLAPTAFAKYLREESARWGEVIHAAQVKIE